ncbi:ABC transporter permease [Paenibacillus sp. MMS18-CY102]|uniref:ABC transporter permease n=1 Tax=Paenibacillus sp. MMS18-CY102 TaxID=2682849 RepID=UPI0013653E1A|nr:ABC transporter permease [Paenibacillus sp. MMS18-CY102]MWC28552.1 FtsX-like permease family protein [Paenibacillus sp. MMS18-CY102]
MVKTRWLTLGTLLGLTLAVSFVMSIPIYANGSLLNVIKRTLDQYDTRTSPGSLVVRYQSVGGEKAGIPSIQSVDAYIREQVPTKLGLPYQVRASQFSLRPANLQPADPVSSDGTIRRQMALTTDIELMSHVQLVSGKAFTAGKAGEEIEAVVMEEALYRYDIRVGDRFIYRLREGSKTKSIPVVITGAVKPKSNQDPYWFKGMDDANNQLFVGKPALLDELVGRQNVQLGSAYWFYSFELGSVTGNDLERLSQTLLRIDNEAYQRLPNTKTDITFLPLLEQFKKTNDGIKRLLFAVSAPMVGLVLYFVWMNGQLSLERQRGDMAVLRSRGASVRQLVIIGLLEGTLVGVIAGAAGSLIAVYMARTIGSSSGFLSFVDRKLLATPLTGEAIGYGAAAILLAIGGQLFSTYRFAKASIVQYKRRSSRGNAKPIWQRFYLDFVLILAVVYGYYTMSRSQPLPIDPSDRTGLGQSWDPVLFFLPSAAVLASALLYIRLFPILLTIIQRIASRRMPIPLYLSIMQMARSFRTYHGLITLLVMTLSLGVYHASTARSIGVNDTRSIIHQQGADAVLELAWEGKQEDNGAGEGAQGGGQGSGTIAYNEPPFELFKQSEGVEAAARVLHKKVPITVSGKDAGEGNLMGINPVDYGRTVSFLKSMMPASPHLYLNLLSHTEQGALIPQSLANAYQIKLGDHIQANMQQGAIEFTVVGIVPYWPGEYPEKLPFAIVNLTYLFQEGPLIPYDIWLKMKPGAKLAPVIDNLNAGGIDLLSIKDTRSEIADQNKQPARGGLYGILSLGFIVSVFVTLSGFALFSFYNLSSRIVQLGTLRAAGLTRRQLAFSLVLEQLFAVGFSILFALLNGTAVSELFLPLLQPRGQVPSFQIVFEPSDALKLAYVVAFMLIAGAMLLFWHVRRLRIQQALRMGEDG